MALRFMRNVLVQPVPQWGIWGFGGGGFSLLAHGVSATLLLLWDPQGKGGYKFLLSYILLTSLRFVSRSLPLPGLSSWSPDKEPICNNQTGVQALCTPTTPQTLGQRTFSGVGVGPLDPPPPFFPSYCLLQDCTS